MTWDRPANITLPQFTAAFVPFAVLLVWALLAPELQPALELGRTKLTIWATTILLLPALVLYLFRSTGRGVANLAHLLWTFAWITFMVHAGWAVFIIFDGVGDTFVQMGTFIAGANFVLTALWTIDIILLWTVARPPAWLWVAQLVVRALTFLIFAYTLLVLREGAVFVLGVILAAAVVLALLVRGWAHTRAPRAAQPASI